MKNNFSFRSVVWFESDKLWKFTDWVYGFTLNSTWKLRIWNLNSLNSDLKLRRLDFSLVLRLNYILNNLIRIFIIRGVTISCDNSSLQPTHVSYYDAFYLRPPAQMGPPTPFSLSTHLRRDNRTTHVPLIKLPPPNVRLSIRIRVLLRCV
jgi:hypothetical protein